MDLRLTALISASLLAAYAAAPARAADAPAPHPSGLHVVSRIAGPDGGWDYASFDPVRRRVYVTHGANLMTIDADSGAANATFAPASRLHAAVPVPGTDLVVTTNSGDKTARVVSAVDGKLLASIATPDDPDGAGYDAASGLVVVICGDGQALALIDPKAQKLVATIALPGKPEFGAPDGKGRYFVNLEDKNAVAVVDLAQRKVTATYALPGCERPTGLAYVAGDRVISDCGNGGVDILEASTGKLHGQFKVGGFPDAVIYDPQRQLAYVPSALGGNLTVIALSGAADNTVIDTVATQLGTRTGTVDPKTGRVYLPTAQYILPAPAGQRPQVKPGTFVVLVLDR